MPRFRCVVFFALGVSACATSPDGGSTLAVTTPTSAAVAPLTTTSTIDRPVEVNVILLGEEEIVFDWDADACGPNTLPDLPTLVFRDAEETINLILSSPSVHRMVGPDFDSLTVDCDPIRVSAEDPDPSAYRFREWMGSLWTEDGQTIYAVIHNEFHGDDASGADSSRDSNGTQGANGWGYLGRTAAGELELEWNGDEWGLDSSNCLVAFWGAHPEVGCRAIRRWTPTETGEVSIHLSVADAGIGGGNGVEVGASLNGEDLWTAVLTEGDTTGTTADLVIPVTAGDELDFWVDARGDASFDATTFRIEINNGERPCTVDDRNRCLMMALTSSVSTDGGDSFQTPDPPGHLIAAVPQPYEPDAGYVGYWQPSNIVRHPSDGHWYMLAQIDVHEASRDVTGMCLLRTDNLADPAAWRAWDGAGFGHVFVDPYGPDAAASSLCKAVVDAPAWSLTWNTYLDRFVLLSEIPRRSPPGIYLRTSADLVDWSTPTLVMESEIGFANGFQTPFESYPSLIDHSSPSRSFDVTGQTGFVYFSRFNGFDPLDFDLFRIPIRLDIEG